MSGKSTNETRIFQAQNMLIPNFNQSSVPLFVSKVSINPINQNIHHWKKIKNHLQEPPVQMHDGLQVLNPDWESQSIHPQMSSLQ